MEETFKIGRRGFTVIVVSLMVAAIILRIKWPDIDIVSSFVEQIFFDKLMMRVIMYALPVLFAFIVFLMPLSMFFLYWCSAVFAGYYVLSAPLEGTLFFALMAIPTLFNRFKIVRFPAAPITLGISAVVLITVVIISAINDVFIIRHIVAKIFLLLPTLHILSMQPGDDSQSRFQSESGQVTTGLSSTQKARMQSITRTNWWELLRPHVESTAINIYKFYERNSEFAINTSKSRATPHLHTQAQDHARNINLANLKKRDGDFDQKAFIVRITKAFSVIQDAIYNQHIEKIQAFVSDALYEQFKSRIDEQQAAGTRYQYEKLEEEPFSIDHAYCDGSFDEIQLLVKASLKESLLDSKTGKTIEAARRRVFYEYWSFIRRPSGKTLKKPGLLEGSCPNCGAPIQIGQATVCSVCNSFIRSGFYDWVLARITQGCEWSYTDPTLVPNWKQLKADDPEFTIHQIEDLAGVIFWNLRLVEISRKVEPIFRFASSECATYIADALRTSESTDRHWWENIALASVSLKGIVIDSERVKLYTLVVWSGIPITANADGAITQRIRYNKPVRDVMVLSRDKKCRTNQNNTLSSAHCKSCGGALSSSFATQCGYCNSTLNDGSEWQLEKILKEDSAEFVEILNQKSEIVSERFAQNMAVEAAKVAEKTKIEETRSGRDIITVMAQVLLADGVIDAAETKFISEMAVKYHMPPEQLEGIIESVKAGEVKFLKPTTAKEAMDTLKGAVSMAYADGVLAPEEEAALERVAKELGYSALDVKRIVKAEEKLMRQTKIKPQRQF
ncbi:MAG: hypothetical protein CVV41_11735 [Candidatus Riflebacteria bacterium HGW-Riflebacteria-1]|jgi:predicted lipid-binding transport protein (Tim44 family)|nr:MAG: hypothetical protein CVV41_11735 [Candidatus Riflebacteria bacterium HGW-Riflebacteria-1]